MGGGVWEMKLDPQATWVLAFVIALGVVFVAAEISPSVTNWLLLLIIVGVVLGRWNQIAPLARLVERVAGE